jgi:hypothetical protein
MKTKLLHLQFTASQLLQLRHDCLTILFCTKWQHVPNPLSAGAGSCVSCGVFEVFIWRNGGSSGRTKTGGTESRRRTGRHAKSRWSIGRRATKARRGSVEIRRRCSTGWPSWQPRRRWRKGWRTTRHSHRRRATITARGTIGSTPHATAIGHHTLRYPHRHGLRRSLEQVGW